MENPPQNEEYLYFVGRASGTAEMVVLRNTAFADALNQIALQFNGKFWRKYAEAVSYFYDEKTGVYYLLAGYPLERHYHWYYGLLDSERKSKEKLDSRIEEGTALIERGKFNEAVSQLSSVWKETRDEELKNFIRKVLGDFAKEVDFKIQPYPKLASTFSEYEQEIKFQVLLKRGEGIPLPDVPVVILFQTGSGWLDPAEVVTDKNGEGKFRIKQFNGPGNQVLRLQTKNFPSFLTPPGQEFSFEVSGERREITKTKYLLRRGEKKEEYFIFAKEGSPLATLRVVMSLEQECTMNFILVPKASSGEATDRLEVRGIDVKDGKEEKIAVPPQDPLDKNRWELDFDPFYIVATIDNYRVKTVRQPDQGDMQIFDFVTVSLGIFYK